MVLFAFSVFNWKYPFWANLVHKNQFSQFKLKFGTESNLDIQNLMVVFTLPVLEWEVPFLGKCGAKSQNCLCKLKYCIYNQSQSI